MLSSAKTKLTKVIEHIRADTAVTFAPRRFPIFSQNASEKRMNTEHWRNTSRGSAKYGEETPLRCHSVYHNPQMISMGKLKKENQYNHNGHNNQEANQ